MRVQTYRETLTESAGHRRHLLLGNGFSIAANPRFLYDSLLEEAFDDERSRPREIFGRIGTTDFETVLNKLDSAGEVLACYPGADTIIADITADRGLIANQLIAALTAIHPATAAVLTDHQYVSCGAFLNEMRRAQQPGLNGLIFTTNYDLLLYWTTMRNYAALQTRDGFGGQGQLQWSSDEQQSVFHLHGALHMFVRADGTIGKHRYDTPLIDQISSLIRRDSFPLFVSEGSSNQKLERINENLYLRDALDRFESSLNLDSTVLYVFGSSFNDDHIADLIVSGTVERVYVSALDVESSRLSMRALEAQWIERRRQADLPTIEVIIFPAAEVAVWGE